MFTPLLFLLLLCASLFFLWCIYKTRKSIHQQEKRIEIEQRERDVARCAKIEEGLMEGLAMLELPQLADQTKLKAISRQLRIVLVEQLMHGPKIR